MGRVAKLLKALHSESEGSQLKAHQVLNWAFGPNLNTRLTVTFRLNKYQIQFAYDYLVKIIYSNFQIS